MNWLYCVVEFVYKFIFPTRVLVGNMKDVSLSCVQMDRLFQIPSTKLTASSFDSISSNGPAALPIFYNKWHIYVSNVYTYMPQTKLFTCSIQGACMRELG